ncbi:MAG: ribosome maturation factor RimM [Hyphomicrobium sp.]|jgi:16S rRNA processing protein RimM|nr:ribosome maturation factor RimM [Hyphomicrobium sp.]
MIDPDRLILLGEIGSAHGIRGEVTVRCFTQEPKNIASYGPLTDKDGQRTFNITGLRVTPKAIIAKFAGVDDRTAAERLRNTRLFVKRSRLPEPEPGSYYYEDLAGLAAVDAGGRVLGTVTGVANYGAGDLLEIADPDGRETFFVPFTDETVPSVDLPSGRATIILPVFAEDDAGDDSDTSDGD